MLLQSLIAQGVDRGNAAFRGNIGLWAKSAFVNKGCFNALPFQIQAQKGTKCGFTAARKTQQPEYRRHAYLACLRIALGACAAPENAWKNAIILPV